MVQKFFNLISFLPFFMSMANAQDLGIRHFYDEDRNTYVVASVENGAGTYKWSMGWKDGAFGEKRKMVIKLYLTTENLEFLQYATGGVSFCLDKGNIDAKSEWLNTRDSVFDSYDKILEISIQEEVATSFMTSPIKKMVLKTSYGKMSLMLYDRYVFLKAYHLLSYLAQQIPDKSLNTDSGKLSRQGTSFN